LNTTQRQKSIRYNKHFHEIRVNKIVIPITYYFNFLDILLLFYSVSERTLIKKEGNNTIELKY